MMLCRLSIRAPYLLKPATVPRLQHQAVPYIRQQSLQVPFNSFITTAAPTTAAPTISSFQSASIVPLSLLQTRPFHTLFRPVPLSSPLSPPLSSPLSLVLSSHQIRSSSTRKKRKKMMNKHKVKKRRKLERRKNNR